MFKQVSALTGVTVGDCLILIMKALISFQKSMNEFRSVAGEGSGGTQGEVEWELRGNREESTVLSSKNNFIFNINLLEGGKKLAILHLLYLSLKLNPAPRFIKNLLLLYISKCILSLENTYMSDISTCSTDLKWFSAIS